MRVMRRIPIGAVLVVLIGPSGAGKSTFAQKHFHPSEVVSTDDIREWIGGDRRRQDMNSAVMDEFHRRIEARLRLGLRVVADGTHCRNTDRIATAKIGRALGVPVHYVIINRSMAAKNQHAGWRADIRVEGDSLIQYWENAFNGNEDKILAGDNLAEGTLADYIIDTRFYDCTPVRPLLRWNDKNKFEAPLHDILGRGYNRITVVGDVHGNVHGLDQVLAHAERKNSFLVFLGDIIDYGKGSLQAAKTVGSLVGHGEAISLFGNHERKIARVILKERTPAGFKGDLSPGNEATLHQLWALEDDKQLAWENQFLGLCATMPHHLIMGDHMFVHGAAHPRMWADDPVFRFNPDSTEESFACYGETSGLFVNGLPERIYNWVDGIPTRKTVVVGHDVRQDTAPLCVRNPNGGEAVFLDTGSSKTDRYSGGHLSWMDLDIEEKRKVGLRLVNPEFYGEQQ